MSAGRQADRVREAIQTDTAVQQFADVPHAKENVVFSKTGAFAGWLKWLDDVKFEMKNLTSAGGRSGVPASWQVTTSPGLVQGGFKLKNVRYCFLMMTHPSGSWLGRTSTGRSTRDLKPRQSAS